MDKIRIGTRGSRLALRQTALVQEAISKACGDIRAELVVLRTRGDQIQDSPISEIGDKGVFASELEQALLSGQIDLAVHSAKDLPMRLAEGLFIAAVLPRADVRDVLVAPKGGRTPLCMPGFCGVWETVSAETAAGVKQKEPGTGHQAEKEADGQGKCGPVFRIGTGSRRRQLLAGAVWENVVCEEIRGNVDTRLRKLAEGGYDGIILAKAGLDRLGKNPDWERNFDFYPLSPEMFLPAACQGIIAVEAAQGSGAAEICKGISDAETELCYRVEREALAQLSADCSEAAAAWCRKRPHETNGKDCETEQEKLMLDVMYAENRVRLTGAAEAETGVQLARLAAQRVKGQAAQKKGKRED